MLTCWHADICGDVTVSLAIDQMTTHTRRYPVRPRYYVTDRELWLIKTKTNRKRSFNFILFLIFLIVSGWPLSEPTPNPIRYRKVPSGTKTYGGRLTDMSVWNWEDNLWKIRQRVRSYERARFSSFSRPLFEAFDGRRLMHHLVTLWRGRHEWHEWHEWHERHEWHCGSLYLRIQIQIMHKEFRPLC